MDEEFNIFEELNLIKSKIDNDLNIIKNLEYDSKIKSINQYNKQLFERLNEQEKIIEEGKNKIENDYRSLDSNLKSLNNEIDEKNAIINDFSNKIDNQNNYLMQKENYIKDIEGKICIYQLKKNLLIMKISLRKSINKSSWRLKIKVI